MTTVSFYMVTAYTPMEATAVSLTPPKSRSEKLGPHTPLASLVASSFRRIVTRV
jgi:hypothetical protein